MNNKIIQIIPCNDEIYIVFTGIDTRQVVSDPFKIRAWGLLEDGMIRPLILVMKGSTVYLDIPQGTHRIDRMIQRSN